MSFRKPINVALTQRFGADFIVNGVWYYKNTLGYLGHNGDDYAAPVGTPVYAADEGTVVFEGWGQNNSWMGVPAGICVLIHNGGVYSGYAHLNSTSVNKGQKVIKGQQIGVVGQTGSATGPHLHFECLPLSPNFKNGYAGRIDPAQYMEAPTTNATADQIRQAYLDILERPADPGALTHYSVYALSFVRSDLAASSEYRTLQANKAQAAQSAAQEAARLAAVEAARVLAEAQAEQERIARELAAAQALKEAADKAAAEANKNSPLDIENNTLLKQILTLLTSLIDKITKVFK